ncbi:MAG: chemotaxis protein CheD [Lachnospiraceae bacterium]
MGEMIKVGIADWKLCNTPNQITTIGLGSCVGVVLYSMNSSCCGLLHILLPSSKEIKNSLNRAKFADTGIDDMLTELIKHGFKQGQVLAKIAGGAAMFQFNNNSDLGSIGDRNVRAVKEALARYNIPIVSEDVGKDYGRTIIFDPQTKVLTIHSAGKKDVYI